MDAHRSTKQSYRSFSSNFQSKLMKIKILPFLLLSLVPSSMGKGEETTTEGANRLSVPVLVVDGTFLLEATLDPTKDFTYHSVALTAAESDCATNSYEEGDFCYYDTTSKTIYWLQKQPDTFWQAQIVTPQTSGMIVVNAIDTGDLLESGGVKRNRRLRIEFSLLQAVSGNLMAFPMVGPLFETQGPGEIHGTSAFNSLNNGSSNELDLIPAVDVLSSTEMPLLNALVYTQCARLSIQSSPTKSKSFNYETGSWNGAATVLAPMSMTTEVTVSGKITYGYNWNRGSVLPGKYRLNFYLDPKCTGCRMQIFHDKTTIINPGKSYTTFLFDPPSDSSCGGGAYIDIDLGSSGGGGGKGGGKGGGGTHGSGKGGGEGEGRSYAQRDSSGLDKKKVKQTKKSGKNKKGGLRNP